MAVTRLKRKHRKNIARANNKQRVIKQLLATPVIKNVDPEELKAQFGKTPAAPAKSDAPAATNAPAATEQEGGLVNTVKDAITGAAQTVVDTVKDVLGKDEKESAE